MSRWGMTFTSAYSRQSRAILTDRQVVGVRKHVETNANTVRRLCMSLFKDGCHYLKLKGNNEYLPTSNGISSKFIELPTAIYVFAVEQYNRTIVNAFRRRVDLHINDGMQPLTVCKCVKAYISPGDNNEILTATQYSCSRDQTTRINYKNYCPISGCVGNIIWQLLSGNTNDLWPCWDLSSFKGKQKFQRPYFCFRGRTTILGYWENTERLLRDHWETPERLLDVWIHEESEMAHFAFERLVNGLHL